MNKPVILCVDDERIILDSLKAQLSHALAEDYRIELAESGEEALEIVEELESDDIELPVVIADQIMGGIYGDQLLAIIKEKSPFTRNIMLTGQATAQAVGEAVNKAELFSYIAKPWEEEDLILTIHSALESYENKLNLNLQESYQHTLNAILKLALTAESIHLQLSETLRLILSTPCFAKADKGSVYFLDSYAAKQSEADFEMIASHNNGDAPDFYGDLERRHTEVELVENNRDYTAMAYYRVPVVVEGDMVCVLYLYVPQNRRSDSYRERFLSVVGRSLVGLIRLSRYHQSLKTHTEHLEELVAIRTQELNNLLRKLEEKNDSLQKANAELEYFATTDELTGLLNRRSFFSQADREASRSHRYDRATLLVMLDVDFFKEVNDAYGHMVGDQVLRYVSSIIADSIREHDIVGRVGGEEFAIVMPETDLEQGRELCERLREKIAEAEVRLEGKRIKVTVSMGVTELKNDEIQISGAMLRADQALYGAKNKGRNIISLN